MTVTEVIPTGPMEEVGASDRSDAPTALSAVDGGGTGDRPTYRLGPGQVVGWVLAVVLALVLVEAVVLYGLGSVSEVRSQRTLLASYRLAITDATSETDGLHTGQLPTQPPSTGSAVGIVDIARLHLQAVVVEGVGSAETENGPGHVPGTAGLGQPGNAAVVGRATGYGGPFGQLDQLGRGDRIVAATTEGQSLYVVRSVRRVSLVTPTATTATAGGTGTSPAGTAASGVTPTPDALAVAGTVSADTLYGPTTDNRLTLVTSASAAPWNADRALVVTAILRGKPFAPTPQQARRAVENGNSGAATAWPALVLALLLLLGTLVGTVFFYRRSTFRIAYLLTSVPLIVFAILVAESAARMFPAWL